VADFAHLVPEVLGNDPSNLAWRRRGKIDAVSPVTHQCPICRSAGNRRHSAREMLIGTRDPFEYAECTSCGCLFLLDPPDLAPYYRAAGYYPLMAADEARPTGLRRLIRVAAAELALRSLPVAAVRRIPNPASGVVEPIPHWSVLLRRGGARPDSAILDVGCGSGGFLYLLRRNGFSNLTGLDPFVPESVGSDGLRIYKSTLEQFEGGPYELVFFNDSFEHVPDPIATLRAAAERLTESGTIVIRTPLADSHAWRTYGANWVALDPPRHLVVQTRASMMKASAEVGLRISEVVYDSTSLQFWGSEQCARDIPLSDARTPAFPKEQLRRWAREADKLNRGQSGDHAAFILRRAATSGGPGIG
jgi:SAM-dependent methyltransferase